MPDSDPALTADAALTARVKTLAAELGFARAGVAPAGVLAHEADRLREWIDAGHHGTMDYMRRTADVRVDPRHPGMLDSARSVIVVAAPYAQAPAAIEGTVAGRIARYAHGRDYHNVLHTRLRKLTRFLREAGHFARAAVDSMPVLERAWAQRAGVGFVGKNCCLIVPGLGSHVFLSAVITSAELVADQPMRERCGDCTLCLDRCPTRAFVAPRWLDARRCIAYLTIEHGGAIERELRPQIGDWLFGCDACQDVCPFNRGTAGAGETPVAAPPLMQSVASEDEEGATALVPRALWTSTDAQAWLEMDDAAFTQVTAGSPLRRPKREGMARNAAIVLGNARERRALPVLQRAAGHDPSEVVRDAASWAVEQIENEAPPRSAGAVPLENEAPPRSAGAVPPNEER